MLLANTSGTVRPRTGLGLLGVRTVAVATLLGVAAAQGSTGLEPRVFAEPWEVTFQHIQDAMAGEWGAYYTEQIRRERIGTSGNVFEGTLEQLTYRPADAASKTPARFKLAFRGIEGRNLNGTDFARMAAQFGSRAGFTFRYKGFQVADAALAAKVYDLVFVARDKRSTQQGIRDVYRMAVIPKRWDRTGWILELDTRTGFPLYAGEYALNAKSIDLQSQLIVTSYLTGVRVPDAKDKSWWSPIKTIEVMASADAALKKALTKSTKYVVPQLAELPGDFRLENSEVHIDPYGGPRTAVLGFTDGVDRIFVTQQNVPFQKRGAEDTIWFLEEKGLTQCGFSHHGVRFRVVGRNVRGAVRALSVGLFGRAIRVLQ